MNLSAERRKTGMRSRNPVIRFRRGYASVYELAMRSDEKTYKLMSARITMLYTECVRKSKGAEKADAAE